MASTYSNLGIELIADGEKPADWGWITNENFEYFDVAIAGAVSIALTSATEPLDITDGVASNARNMYITFTGTPGATCVVTVGPNTFEKLYFFQNDTNQTVTITQGSGGDVDILTGNAAVVHCDGAGSGAEVVDITDNFVSYTHPTHNGDDISIANTALTGATIFNDVDIVVTTDTLGHVTAASGATSTRELTLANLGYTGTTDANTYVHPSHTARTEGLDTGPLTGATVIDDLDFNLSSDTLGHVTACDFTVAGTRELTLANLGYTGTTDANTYVHPNHSGQVTSSADGAQSLAVSAITAQTDFTGTLASTDEVIFSDAGALKKMDVAIIEAYMLANLGFTVDSHPADTTTHGATGAVVGTTNTQTLTNKTLDDAIFTGSIDEQVHALSTGTVLNPANGTIQTVTLTAIRTFTASFNEGEAMTLMLLNTTVYAVTWPTITWHGTGGATTAPDLTGNDVIELWKIGTTIHGASAGGVA